jgi:AcrR family transcriptional regulator
MRARADQVRETERRIVAAMRELAFGRGLYFDEITLREVAAIAGVTEQTVIRRFTSKEGLLEALIDELSPEIDSGRATVPVGDVEAAVRMVVSEYEVIGDGTLRALDQEARVAPVARALAVGRASHRRWCARTFAPYLPGPRQRGYARRLTLFVTATDVYTWKLLRRDAGLSRSQAELGMRELVRALVQQHQTSEESDA